MDSDLPHHINYWMTSSIKHDCVFYVGPESGPQERIGAIKILLMGHSEVFRKMLDSSESSLAETGDIFVPDSDPETFRNFLICIYGGTKIMIRKLSFEASIHVLYLCEKYLMTDIKLEITTCLVETHNPLSLDHVFTCLFNPVSLESEVIANAVSRIIQENTKKIIKDERFTQLGKIAMLFIVKQNHLSITEIVLWKALLKWGLDDTGLDTAEGISSDQRKLLPLVSSIRFCTMSAYNFCTYVVPSKVLTPTQISQICLSIGSKTEYNISGINSTITNRIKIPIKSIMIFHILHPVSTFNGRSKSETKLMDGFNWNIMLKKTENSFGLFVQCEPIVYRSSWRYCASAQLIIINHIGGRVLQTKLEDHLFTEQDFDWGYLHIMTWQELIQPEHGFVKNNSIEVRVKVSSSENCQ